MRERTMAFLVPGIVFFKLQMLISMKSNVLIINGNIISVVMMIGFSARKLICGFFCDNRNEFLIIPHIFHFMVTRTFVKFCNQIIICCAGLLACNVLNAVKVSDDDSRNCSIYRIF